MVSLMQCNHDEAWFFGIRQAHGGNLVSTASKYDSQRTFQAIIGEHKLAA